MTRRLYIKDLECYQCANESEKNNRLRSVERFFDLEKLPNHDLQKEMEVFIKERGRKLALSSMRGELYPFHQLCAFLTEEYPSIKSVTEIPEERMLKKLKVWLLKNGKHLTQKRIKTETGKIQISDADVIKYIRKLYVFLTPEDSTFCMESDRWYLENLPFHIRDNLAKPTRSISFRKIYQKDIKLIVKKVAYMHLEQKAVSTVRMELAAVNRFSGFLQERFPDIESLQEVDREVLEEYLVYIHTEARGKKSYSKELCHLKSVFLRAGKILGNKELEFLFFDDDLGRNQERVFRFYSDSELKRLNAAIFTIDEQVARALFLHQLLGTRISETLTLKRDSVYRGENGHWMIRIEQTKTQRKYVKGISMDVKKIFDKSCDYTQERYGNTEYVFVREKDPSRPMTYSRIQYQLMAMITKQDLRDDHGELFAVGTHLWRHTYGKKLTEMHVDDVTIAKLLGHSNTNTLRYYRKVGNEMLSEETRYARESMDRILKDVVEQWE